MRAWMQRAGLETILGLRIEGNTLRLDPCIPRSWPGFEISLRRGGSRYEIAVENPDGVERGIAAAKIDGAEVAAQRPLIVAVVDDGAVHRVWIKLG